MAEPWSRAEADRVSDDTLALLAEIQKDWPDRFDRELQELIWDDEKRVLDTFKRADMAVYEAAHASMRRKITEYTRGEVGSKCPDAPVPRELGTGARPSWPPAALTATTTTPVAPPRGAATPRRPPAVHAPLRRCVR